MKMPIQCACLLAAACAFAPAAHAATFCVSNAAALELALLTAEDNGQDDHIYLETGNYLPAHELQYVAPVEESYDLALSGGYAPGSGCHAKATSGASVLDGQGSMRLLYISAHGGVRIDSLSFTNGKASQYAGGALNLSGPYVDVESNVFINNEVGSGSTGGAAYLYSPGFVNLVSNLFIANSGSGVSAVFLLSDYLADVNNNTFIANTLVNGGLGALDLVGAGHFNLSNNILWNNDGTDVYDQAGDSVYQHNDIGVMGGYAPVSETGDISVAPEFDGFLSVRPAPHSALVNAGVDSPLGGIGGADAGGGTRRVGAHVDLGAYESDVLLRAGFEAGQ